MDKKLHTVEDKIISYSVEGTGAPVVLLHGSMTSKTQWFELIGLLESEYKTISIDMHGFGETSFPLNEDSFCLADEVKLVNQVLKEEIEENAKFHLIAHSYGGAVALLLARSNPAALSTLILLDPGAMQLLREGDHEFDAMARKATEKFFKEETLEAAEILVDWHTEKETFKKLPKSWQMTLSERMEQAWLNLRAVRMETTILEDYENIAAKTCLIGGRKSPEVYHKIIYSLEKTFQNCESHWFEGGHMTPVFDPFEVNEIIVSFLSKNR